METNCQTSKFQTNSKAISKFSQEIRKHTQIPNLLLHFILDKKYYPLSDAYPIRIRPCLQCIMQCIKYENSKFSNNFQFLFSSFQETQSTFHVWTLHQASLNQIFLQPLPIHRTHRWSSVTDLHRHQFRARA